MTEEEIVSYCGSKEGAALSLPFGESPVCFKAGGRIFCELFKQGGDLKVTLRCEPQLACLLREEYEGDVVPGYHCPQAIRRYKNTVTLNRSVPDAQVLKMIDHAYEEVMHRTGKNRG